MSTKYQNQSGFIALMSAIIISMLLIVITFTLSMTAFFARFNVLHSEYKNISSNLAEGCVDAALLKLINDPAYNPTDEIVSVGTHNCMIVSITPLTSPRIINTQALYPASGSEKSYTNVQVTITQSPSSIVIHDWQEVAHF
ncbi:MAG: hypothetical protein AAB590_03600 [Patescibacteria group bacterium]